MISPIATNLDPKIMHTEGKPGKPLDFILPAWVSRELMDTDGEENGSESGETKTGDMQNSKDAMSMSDTFPPDERVATGIPQ